MQNTEKGKHGKGAMTLLGKRSNNTLKTFIPCSLTHQFFVCVCICSFFRMSSLTLRSICSSSWCSYFISFPFLHLSLSLCVSLGFCTLFASCCSFYLYFRCCSMYYASLSFLRIVHYSSAMKVCVFSSFFLVQLVPSTLFHHNKITWNIVYLAR